MAVQQRGIGRRNVLREIRNAGQIARIDLAERTGLSRATVTEITAEFLGNGLIEEVPRPARSEAAGRGRPRVDLRIRGAARMVAGVRVGTRTLSLVLLDFEGRELANSTLDLARQTNSAEALIAAIGDALDRLAICAGCDRSAISGLGVAIAGVVEADKGLVHWSPSLDRRNVPLARMLTARLNLPAFVDNDANLVAVAESLFGLGRGRSDFLVVTIESGVGLGIVQDGKLFRGTRGCGAEFGHIKVQPNGALCRCGQRGCLEAYVADYALLRDAAIQQPDPPAIAPEDRLDALLLAARDGEPVARGILNRAGQVFAMGLANLVNLFDPSLIILAGEKMPFDHLYAEQVIETMRQSVVQVDRPPPEVVVHKWGDLLWAKGAAAFGLDQVSELALGALGGKPGAASVAAS